MLIKPIPSLTLYLIFNHHPPSFISLGYFPFIIFHCRFPTNTSGIREYSALILYSPESRLCLCNCISPVRILLAFGVAQVPRIFCITNIPYSFPFCSLIELIKCNINKVLKERENNRTSWSSYFHSGLKFCIFFLQKVSLFTLRVQENLGTTLLADKTKYVPLMNVHAFSFFFFL